MPAERISVQLTVFNKLEVLRRERGERAEELTEVEAAIRRKIEAVEIHRYLESLSPYYAMNTNGLPTHDEIDQLEEKRNLLIDLIASIDREIPALNDMAEKGGAAAPAEAPPPAGQQPAGEGTARKAKFDF